VTATNLDGESDKSESSDLLVLVEATVPSAPGTPTIAISGNDVVAIWTAPSSDGGCEILEYTILGKSAAGSFENGPVVSAPTLTYTETITEEFRL